MLFIYSIFASKLSTVGFTPHMIFALAEDSELLEIIEQVDYM